MTTGIVAALVALLLICVLGFVVWASKRSERYGRHTAIADEADELLAIAEEKQEAERALEDHIAAHPERRAVDRLRNSKWNRDN